MTIYVRRDTSQPLRHTVTVRGHAFTIDGSVALGGNDEGPDPHDLYDAALGACEALTMVIYAKRKGIALDDVEITVHRDASAERQGQYVLDTTLRLSGALSDEQRRELLAVAGKCPLHKLMTKVTTVINTKLA